MNRQSQATEAARKLLDEVVGREVGRTVGVRLWDGASWPDAAPRPVTLVLKHEGALKAMFQDGTELALAEAFLYDDFDIEGDIESAFVLYDALTEATLGWKEKLKAAHLAGRLPDPPARSEDQRGRARLQGERHSVERDRQAVSYHYDVSNDFYRLWLDRNMVYSCGYFHAADEHIDSAQERKLDYICRKLRLQEGQRLLDVGCGWGTLVIHAAKHYGVDATGVTLSEPQAELANQWIREAGLADRARVRVLDYREAGRPDGKGYDAVASVGMFEHVGVAMLEEYFCRVRDMLRPGGVMLNHGISSRIDIQPAEDAGFVGTYVFPDGELTPIGHALQAAERAGFEVRDVENLREHYALTLRNWVHRLEARHQEALRYVDEPTFRVWRLFMAAAAYGFSRGWFNLHQSLLLRPDEAGRSGLPLTREDWYTPRTGV
ncbi:MAG: cyclopropane-fatty-acyl-phospholipid synthase family protein [Synergistales bacterium]|nr:cyclopropane-fatty-acyl-phospholipid synthase family protein [Synergistales bacterium]